METLITLDNQGCHYELDNQPILCLEYVAMILNCKQEDVPESLSMCMTEESMGHGSVGFQWDSSHSIRFLDPKMSRAYRPHKYHTTGHVTYRALRKAWMDTSLSNRFWLTIRKV
jgi:hypothetical protein